MRSSCSEASSPNWRRAPRSKARRHLNAWFAFSPGARATNATIAPGSSVRSTICRFSATDRNRWTGGAVRSASTMNTSSDTDRRTSQRGKPDAYHGCQGGKSDRNRGRRLPVGARRTGRQEEAGRISAVNHGFGIHVRCFAGQHRFRQQFLDAGRKLSNPRPILAEVGCRGGYWMPALWRRAGHRCGTGFGHCHF